MSDDIKFKPTEVPIELDFQANDFLTQEGKEGTYGQYWIMRGKLPTGQSFVWFVGNERDRDKLVAQGAQNGGKFTIYQKDSGKVSKRGTKLFDLVVEGGVPTQAPNPSRPTQEPAIGYLQMIAEQSAYLFGIAAERFSEESAIQAHFSTLFIQWNKDGRPPLYEEN